MSGFERLQPLLQIVLARTRRPTAEQPKGQRVKQKKNSPKQVENEGSLLPTRSPSISQARLKKHGQTKKEKGRRVEKGQGSRLLT